MSLEITVAETPKEQREYITFQWQVYRGDPYWVPPLLSEREAFLDRARHPFHKHAEVRYFIARRDGKPVGTITGIINHAHNAFWQDQVGFFGLFECFNDPEAAHALLTAAEDFVRSHGMTSIRGPFNFSTNEECGLLVDGWNGTPVVMMTYNPRYYVNLIEGAGYTTAMNMWAYDVDLTRYGRDGSGLDPKLLRVAEKVRERNNFTIRKGDPKHMDREMEAFKKVYNNAWAKNWGFVPMTDEEIAFVGKNLIQLLDFETVFFVEKDGEPVAFMLPIPDVNQALHKAYPRPETPEWWTLLKFFYWWKVRKSVTCIRAMAGGVVQEYRGRGVEALQGLEAIKACIRQGYKRTELSWILESNTPMTQFADVLGGVIYRRYRIYEKTL